MSLTNDPNSTIYKITNVYISAIRSEENFELIKTAALRIERTTNILLAGKEIH